MATIFELNKNSFKTPGPKLGIKNPMQSPKLVKLVI